MALGSVALGVDYGTVRIGIGVSAGYAPRPLMTFAHPGNDKTAVRQILKLAAGESAERVVVGLPLSRDGLETFQAQLTRNFTNLLARTAMSGRRQVEVYLVDERFTSAEAEARMQHKNQVKMKAVLDAESACSILAAFFDGEGAELVDPSSMQVCPEENDISEEFPHRPQRGGKADLAAPTSDEEKYLSMEGMLQSREEAFMNSLVGELDELGNISGTEYGAAAKTSAHSIDGRATS